MGKQAESYVDFDRNLQSYLALSDAGEDRKAKLLRSIVQGDAATFLPEDTENTIHTYDQLRAALMEQYGPAAQAAQMRYDINSRKQEEYESVANYSDWFVESVTLYKILYI